MFFLRERISLVACFGIHLSISKLRKPFCGTDGAVVMKEIRVTPACPQFRLWKFRGMTVRDAPTFDFNTPEYQPGRIAARPFLFYIRAVVSIKGPFP